MQFRLRKQGMVHSRLNASDDATHLTADQNRAHCKLYGLHAYYTSCMLKFHITCFIVASVNSRFADTYHISFSPLSRSHV